jgi:hypothetical protein
MASDFPPGICFEGLEMQEMGDKRLVRFFFSWQAVVGSRGGRKEKTVMIHQILPSPLVS